jgi:DNA-binding PadR family transcriptional regulator
MAQDALLKHFFGGFVRLHILYHAQQGPIFGMEMIEELRRHGYQLGPGTLYPILHHLEADGYLACETEVVAGKRRKNYRITAKGSRLLSHARTKLRELFAEVIGDNDLLTKTNSKR